MTINHTININRILSNTPELKSEHSLVILCSIGIASKNLGYQLFELGSESISSLIDQYFNYDIYGRSAIIHALSLFLNSRVMEKEIFNQYQTWLSDEELPIQYVILTALVSSKHEDTGKLVKKYLKHPSDYLVSAAIATLSKLDTRAALTYLMLSDDIKDKQRRLENIILNSEESKTQLSKVQILALMSTPYDSVRSLTLDRLVKPETLSFSELAIILEDENFIVRQKALHLLENKLDPEFAVEILVDFLFDRNENVVTTAKNLIKPHLSITYDKLIKISDKLKGFSLYAVVDLVASKKEDKLVDIFGKALHERCQVKYRKRIVRWLEKQNDFEKVKPYLFHSLADESTEVSSIARKALEKYNDEDSKNRILQDAMESSRVSHVLEVLEKTTCFSRADRLKVLVNSIENKAHQSCLGRISSLLEREQLIEALPSLKAARKNSRSVYKREYDSIISILESFATSAEKNSYLDLKGKLEGSSKLEKMAALTLLKDDSYKGFLGSIKKLLFDVDPEIRTSAANCLLRIGDKTVAYELRSKFPLQDGLVQQHSAEALSIVGDEKDINLIAKALYKEGSQEPDVAIENTLVNLGWTKESVNKHYRYLKVDSLLRDNMHIDLATVTGWSKLDIVNALESMLEPSSDCTNYIIPLRVLKSLSWKPEEPHHVLLDQSREDNPSLKPLTEFSGKWLVCFCKKHGMNSCIREVIDALAGSGVDYKMTLMSCLEVVSADIKADLISLNIFNESDVENFLRNFGDSSVVYGFRLAATNRWYACADILQERYTSLIEQENLGLMHACIPYIAQVSPDYTERVLIELLSERRLSNADYIYASFLDVLSDLSGKQSVFIYMKYLRSMNRTYSKNALSALTKSDWQPHSTEESIIKNLVSIEHRSLSQFGESAMDYCIEYLEAGNQCTVELLDYLHPYLITSHQKRVVECVLACQRHSTVTTEFLARFLSEQAEISTKKLLAELGPVYSSDSSDFNKVRLLCQVGTRSATPFLISVIKSGSVIHTRDAVDAVSRLKDQDAAPALIELAPTIRDKSLYSATIKCLAKLPCKASVEYLTKIHPELTTKTLASAVERALKKWRKSIE